MPALYATEAEVIEYARDSGYALPGTSTPPGVVGAWQTPTYEPGWQDSGAPYSGLEYRRVFDQVEFRGAMQQPAGVGGLAFTLPPNFRPESQVILLVIQDDAGTIGEVPVTVGADGTVTVSATEIVGPPGVPLIFDARVFSVPSVSDVEVVDPDALTRLIERSQLDVDSILGSYEIIGAGTYTGLKLDVTTLDFAQAAGLRRATCAQVLYRLEMGEQFFVRPQVENVSGPEFTEKGKKPRVSPAAKQELSGLNLIRRTTAISNKGRGLPPWYDFSYNVTPESDGDFGGLNRGVLP